MNDLDTKTDRELIDELSSRYDKLIVIRPDRKKENKVLVFCNTKNDMDVPYTLIEATEMLQDAHIGLITDCFEALRQSNEKD